MRGLVAFRYASTGKLVEMVNTNQLVNNGMAISPDGRFFAAATFTADVKIWELSWGKGAADTSVKVEIIIIIRA
jgi:sugar lactone lactonase YvrE